ncbi:hypothetical protein K6118_17120, partial [Kordiimonas sp. A6E486]
MTGYLVVALVDLAVALGVLRVSRRRTSQAFALLWFCFAVWTYTLYLETSTQDVVDLAAWLHPLRFGMFFIAPAMMLFTCLVTRTELTRQLKLTIVASALFSTGLYIWNLMVQPSVLVMSGAGYTTAPDLVSHLHEVNFVSACLISVAVAVTAYRHALFRERQRIWWLAVSIGMGAMLGILSFNHSKLFGMAGNLVGLAGLSYALLRYHVVHVSQAFRAVLVRAVSFVCLMLAFLGLTVTLGHFSVSSSETLAIEIAALFALFEIYPPLTRKLGALADAYLFPEEYHYDFTREWLLKALKNCATPDGFRQVTDELCLKLVRVDSYSIHLVPRLFGEAGDGLRLFDPREKQTSAPVSPIGEGAFFQMLLAQEETLFYDEAAPAFKGDFARLGASALVPVRIADETVGFILLGAPKKTEQFSYDDIRLLNWFGGEVGPVLENLLAMMRLESSLDEAEKTLSVVSRLNEYNHDIKTPFSNIEALLLAGDAFSAEERQAKILDQVRKGHALVSTMTGLLKGRHTHRAGAYDLNAIIRRVVASFPTKAKLVDLSLCPLPMLEGYEDEMELLFSNLLSNAFAAQDKPEHQVRV